MNVGHVYVVHTVLTKPPKDKIALCVCDEERVFFWFNTNARPHGVGQLPVSAAECPGITHGCYLDCSRVAGFLPAEIEEAAQRGPISKAFAGRIYELLTVAPPKTLTPKHLNVTVRNIGRLL